MATPRAGLPLPAVAEFPFLCDLCYLCHRGPPGGSGKAYLSVDGSEFL